MSNVLFITDTHLGARSGSTAFRELFRRYYVNTLFPYIEDNDIKTVIHLGDFFDDTNAINVKDIDFLLSEYVHAFQKTGAHMYVVSGNHDTYYKTTNTTHATVLLQMFPDAFTVVHDDIKTLDVDGQKFVLCPWISPDNHERLMEGIKTYAYDDTILCGHFEVKGAKMYKSSPRCEHGVEPNVFKRYQRVLSGHFHTPNTINNIDYIGALFHYNWEDYNDWRGFTTYDTDTKAFDKVENTDCLFMQCTYPTDEDLDVTGKYVRVVIESETKRVEFQDWKKAIESKNPAKLDIIDLSVLASSVDVTNEDDRQDMDNKGIVDYAHEYVREHAQGDKLVQTFRQLYESSLNNRVA